MGKDACCQSKTASSGCPACGSATRPVGAATLDHHLPPELRAAFGEQGGFCPNPACEVVYCNDRGMRVTREQILLPVTIKDPGDDVRVCYCFDFTRGDLRRDLTDKGSTEIPDQIKKGIKDGQCDCERKNPQGSCCLGNVAAAIKDIQAKAVRR